MRRARTARHSSTRPSSRLGGSGDTRGGTGCTAQRVLQLSRGIGPSPGHAGFAERRQHPCRVDLSYRFGDLTDKKQHWNAKLYVD